MAENSLLRMFAACAVYLFAGSLVPIEAADPPYVFLLRSRDAVVTPEKRWDSQTGGGFVQVTQVKPNTMMVVMRGAAAAGNGHHKEGSAALQFTFHQDFEIIATRDGLRPPRLTLAGWVIGALESTHKDGGTAEHGPACAAIRSGDETLLQLCVKAHGVGGGENLLINDRVGPLETVAAPGGFCLHQTFALRATQNRSACHLGSAAAQFDPNPKLDPQWNEVLRPFRAVPQKDFGFRVLMHVVEDKPPGIAPQDLPPPKLTTDNTDNTDKNNKN